jgi:hypothetical protein
MIDALGIVILRAVSVFAGTDPVIVEIDAPL